MSIEPFVELVSLFQANAANRPFWLFLALLIALTAAARLAPAWMSTGGRTRRRVALVFAVLTLAWYVVTVVWYVGQPQYVDHAEPTMAAVGWLFETGRPVYHARDSAERYAHMYGPLAFAIPGWFLAWLGPSIEASKVSGAVAGLVGLGVVYQLARTAGAQHRSVILTGLFAGLCLAFRHCSFWIRPDSLQLLFASLALLAAVASRAPVAAIGLGLATGVLVNLKMTGPLYVLSAYAVVAARFGPAPALAAGALAALAAAAPFAAYDNVSLTNYLHWVRVSATNGLEFRILRQNIEWALFFLVPLAPVLLAAPQIVLPPRAFRALVTAFAVGLIGVVVAASKPGAGPYHLMPFLPVLIYILALHQTRRPAARGASAALHRGGRDARLARRDNRKYRLYLRAEQRRQAGWIARRMQRDVRHGLLNAGPAAVADDSPSNLPPHLRPLYRRGCAAFIVATSLVAVAQQTYFLWAARLSPGTAVVDDLEQFAAAHPGERIAMGASDDDEHLTLARPVLVFMNDRYLIDVPAVQEYQMSGLDLPPATLRAIRDCAVDIWLIPRNGRPFQTLNNYPSTGYRELFPESFRHAFFEAYAPAGSTRFYIVWQCQRPANR